MTELVDGKAGVDSPPPSERKSTAFDLIYKHTSGAIAPYGEILKSDAEDRVSDLGTGAKEYLDKHLGELEELQKFLDRIRSGEKFRQVVRSSRLQDKELNPRQIFSAKLAPVGETLPTGDKKPQVQFSFHGNIDAYETESLGQALYSLSLTKSPPDVLAKLFRSTTEHMIIINTQGAYMDTNGEIKVIPQAGITFRWRRGGTDAQAGGVVYVGLRPHVMEMQRRVPLEDFVKMERTIMTLSGFKPQSPHSMK